MSIASKLIRANKPTKSRLHDEKGNFVGWTRLFLHGPKAICGGLLRLAFGFRPAKPWIAYSAIDYLETQLSRNSRVLEYGSGMSTVWYAGIAGEVCSVEDYLPWYNKISNLLKELNLTNVHYRFAASETEYLEFMSGDQPGFDLIVVDGSSRSKCVLKAITLLRAGGILYLDNSDTHMGPAGGDMRLAENAAREFAVKNGCLIHEFTDFAPTQLFVQQGLLVQLPNGTAP